MSYLEKLERGDRHLSDLRLLNRLAEHLRVAVADLLGDTAVPLAPADDPRVTPIGEALLDHRQLFGGAPASAHVVSALESERAAFQVSTAWRAFQAGRYADMTAVLPAALRRLQAPTTSRQRRVAALGHHAAAALLSRLGAPDLALLSAERGLRIARELDDAVVVGSLVRGVAHTLLAGGRPEPALALTQTVAGWSGVQLPVLGVTGLSVHGTLLLNGAVAAGRLGDRLATAELLEEAGRTADRMGADRNELWTAFGPTNVAVHRVATAVEFDDVELALRLGEVLDTAILPAERRARLDLDVAWAAARRGRYDLAVDRLLGAERTAPELLAAHRKGREVARDLLRSRAGRRRDLVDLAGRIGV